MNPIGSIIDEFISKRAQIEMCRDEMISYLKPFGKNVLLYGAGSSGIAFLYDLKKIDITPANFVDSNRRKIGDICEGIEIISPDAIQERVDGDFIVIVCINTDGKRYCKSFDEALRTGGHHGVYDMLHRAGCKNVIDYTFFRRCFSIFTDERYNAPSCSDVDLMVANADSVIGAYDLLSDELSKETYEKIVRFRLLDDSLEVPTLPQNTQYFERGLYHSREDAVFLDCGAYNGISARTFLEIQDNRFGYYYGLEPDRQNYEELKNYIEALPEYIKQKMTISESAAWDNNEVVDLYSLGGPGSFASSDIGTTKVRGCMIDSMIRDADKSPGSKVTFIKMNIEGSEIRALRGAEQTITADKPELAIAGYHRTDHLWRVPMMIKRFRQDYSLNLRSYMNHISFVYYAG